MFIQGNQFEEDPRRHQNRTASAPKAISLGRLPGRKLLSLRERVDVACLCGWDRASVECRRGGKATPRPDTCDQTLFLVEACKAATLTRAQPHLLSRRCLSLALGGF